MPNPEPVALARALGRVPTGLYVVTTREAQERRGFVASFVMQVGLRPAALCVAIGHDREPLDLLRRSGRFAVCVLDEGSQGLMKSFLRKPAAGGSPFDAVRWQDAPEGSPILSDALAWIECRLLGEHALEDHAVVFGEALAGDCLRQGDPAIRLRRNGLEY